VFDFDPTKGLRAGMEEYLREMNRARLGPPPRSALAAGAGLEFFSLPAHLALTAPPYVALGAYLRRRGNLSRGILDLGCGCGGGTCFLKRRSPRGTFVAGLDLLRPLLARAAGACPPGPAFLAATAVALPFPEGAFSLVSSVFSLVHHLDAPALKAVFREAARVLEPGGIFVFTTPNRGLSQELYHPNRGDAPSLRFSRLNRREFAPEGLRSFLDGLVESPEGLFDGYALYGLFNPVFQPVWEETVREMGRKRFGGNRLTAASAALARYVLTPSSRTRYFLSRLNENAAKMKASPAAIASSAAFGPVGAGDGALHFLAALRKGEGP